MSKQHCPWFARLDVFKCVAERVFIGVFVLAPLFILNTSALASPPAKSHTNDPRSVADAPILTPTLPKAPYISVEEVKTWLKDNQTVEIIDVREPAEYTVSHIESAVNIPFAQAEERLDEFDKEKTKVIYCIHSAWRAPYVANLLLDHGFKNVYVLDGGIAAWFGQGSEIKNKPSFTEPVIAPYPKDLQKELNHPPSAEYQTKINLTLNQLKEFNGQNGRPAFIAYRGVIYDVTTSRLWRGGHHDPSKGKAAAGQDVSEILHMAPHGVENLEKFPVVGQLIEDQKEK